ncbi:MAG: OOP family OmpA-OmpF porin [Crocinitomix sp.]
MFVSEYMRLILIIFLIISLQLHGQLNYLEGSWQGILTQTGQSPKDGKAIWFDFTVDPVSGDMKGESRVETPFTKYFAYKKVVGTVKSKREISFKDDFIGLDKNAGTDVWCLTKGDLVYTDSTGYLKGKWISSDCRQGGIISLYRSKYKLSKTDSMTLYHSWFNNMVNDLSRGWNAYYVREAEMRDFQFVPVYFDHDKDILKATFDDYLNKMANIVNSHSDLRIKIIGHTDSNGSDNYNVGLSERRAERVKSFLIAAGAPSDKIVIEYRGEKDPATTNNTSFGKQLNRRVDFEFI